MENSFIHTKISIEEVFPDAFPTLKREQYYKLSESEGLLHTVQKIIFDEWSDQLREQVHKNCLEDLGNADKFTYFVYYKLNVREDPLHSYLNGQSFVNFEKFRVNLLQLSLPPTFLSV